MRTPWNVSVLFALLAVAVPGHGLAQDAERGRALASSLCAQCHLNPGQGEKLGRSGVPGFEAIAKRHGQSIEGIIAWLASAPPMMPDHRLTRDERFALAAYIMTLRNAGSAGQR